MREGQFVALWMSDGRLVTRWKDARANILHAVIADSREEMVETLSKKLGKATAATIGIFQFVGCAPMTPDTVTKNAQPIAAFAQVLSNAELHQKFAEVLTLADRAKEAGPFWAEIFVRPKTRISDEDARKQLPGPRPSGRHPGKFRRD